MNPCSDLKECSQMSEARSPVLLQLWTEQIRMWHLSKSHHALTSVCHKMLSFLQQTFSFTFSHAAALLWNNKMVVHPGPEPELSRPQPGLKVHLPTTQGLKDRERFKEDSMVPESNICGWTWKCPPPVDLVFFANKLTTKKDPSTNSSSIFICHPGGQIRGNLMCFLEQSFHKSKYEVNKK